jgi:DNA-binding NtrC family response regulator
LIRALSDDPAKAQRTPSYAGPSAEPRNSYMKHVATFLAQTLLIADGDAELCDLYRQFLTKRGYEVETSSDGLNCLRKLRQVTPAAIVLDLELRWGGGDGILAWLREEYPAHGIPVILTATVGYPQAFASFNEPPVVDYLPKPFGLTTLLEKVRSAVAEKIQREPSNRHRACPERFIG